jgi:hypothetical protein
MLDRLPQNREDAPWLWILAAQAEADLSLVRRMAIVEVLRDGRPHPALDLQAAVEDRLGEGCFGVQVEQTLEADIWDDEQVEAEVRRLMTGVEPTMG